MNKLVVAVVAAGLLSFGTLASGESIVFDSFESGDFSAQSAPGFKWSTNSALTSIVTSTTELFRKSLINEPAPEGSQWEAKNGEHALRLLYPAGKHWTEQKFYLSEPQQEIWIQYWIRVPTNYAHTDVSSNNNKFFALWMDEYSGKGAGATVFWNTWRDDSDGGSKLAFSYNEGGYDRSSGQIRHVKFIEVPEDRGRWMQVLYNIRASSTADSSDGYVAFWRRWEGEQEFTRLQEVTDIKLMVPPGGPNGWSAGYLMGYANATYAEDTEWLIDDFVVATHSLLSHSNLDLPNSPILEVH